MAGLAKFVKQFGPHIDFDDVANAAYISIDEANGALRQIEVPFGVRVVIDVDADGLIVGIEFLSEPIVGDEPFVGDVGNWFSPDEVRGRH